MCLPLDLAALTIHTLPSSISSLSILLSFIQRRSSNLIDARPNENAVHFSTESTPSTVFPSKDLLQEDLT